MKCCGRRIFHNNYFGTPNKILNLLYKLKKKKKTQITTKIVQTTTRLGQITTNEQNIKPKAHSKTKIKNKNFKSF